MMYGRDIKNICRIRRIISAAVIFASVIFFISYGVFASDDIKIYVDGNMSDGVGAFIDDGATLVPMRTVFEMLGADVNWDEASRKALSVQENTTVEIYPDRGIVLKNGNIVELNHIPIIKNDRIYLPLRAVAEAFGCTVSWDGKTQSVYIGRLGEMKIHFLDCGQADCIFIELLQGKCMLVDSGTNRFADTLISYVKNLGYSKIDYVVATHPHADHIGSMADVLNSFEIGNFYMPKVSYTTKTFERMIDALEKNGCTCSYIKCGDTVFDGNAVCKVFAPQDKTYMEMNDYSAVLMLTMGKISIMLAGDAEALSERDMTETGLDLKSDIIKIGHHGSITSTSESFIDAVSPKMAVISVGKDNEYGFPKKDVLDRLSERGIQVYRTDINGDITVKTDGYVYTAECAR